MECKYCSYDTDQTSGICDICVLDFNYDEPMYQKLKQIGYTTGSNNPYLNTPPHTRGSKSN